MSSQTVSSDASVTLPNSTFTRSGYEFVGWNTNADGTGTAYTDGQMITPSGDLSLYAQWRQLFVYNGYEYVDLGLPSGILWSTCNLGANSPEEVGAYYAWGEIEPKLVYSMGNYKWSDYDYYLQEYMLFFKKYNVDIYSNHWDGKSKLELSDDAAYVNMNGSGRIPTDAEIKELIDNCNFDKKTINGVDGIKLISKINGSSIFLPFTGVYNGSNLILTSQGFYWSNCINKNKDDNSYASGLILFEEPKLSSMIRSEGIIIRPVIEKK